MKKLKKNERKGHFHTTAFLLFDSISVFGMLVFPIIDPLRDSSTVTIHVTILFAVQLDHNLLIESLAGFLEKNTEDLRI